MNNKRLIGFFIPAVLLLALFMGGMIYLCTFLHAKNVENCFVKSAAVSVSETDYGYYFDGKGEEKALVFYPGARVESRAYAPLMRRLAEEGIDCYLMVMPFHMAIFDVNAADKVIDDSHTEWYIGGHSMGGAMAASYLSGTEKEIEGIVLLAAYSAEDLTDTGVPALSVYGSLDGVLNREKVAKGREYFSDYTEQVLEGGNHAQFGSYGEQSGDHAAVISADDQLERTVQCILEFVGSST